MVNYDIIIIGGGPGGYTAAIRAAQLGRKVAVVERSQIGGVCLNWGCIPSKALLKSAQVFHYARNLASYGVSLTGSGDVVPDLPRMVERSRAVVAHMNKGVEFLLSKNKIDVIRGEGRLRPGGKETVGSGEWVVGVTNGESITQLTAPHVVLATGSRPRSLPALPVNGVEVIDSSGAMTLQSIPRSMVVVGSGAIGCEFAWLYATLGTKVTLVELLPRILPAEDGDVSREMARVFRKRGVEVLTSTTVQSVSTTGGRCAVTVETDGPSRVIEAEKVLSAAGVRSNLEVLCGFDQAVSEPECNRRQAKRHRAHSNGRGAKEEGGANACEAARTGVYYDVNEDRSSERNEAFGFRDGLVEHDKITVDKYYRTSAPGVYAIGDIVPGPALAHVAAAEGICCIEAICGLSPESIDYAAVPSCVFTSPEVASVGLRSEQAAEQGLEVKVGIFPFMASGKATAVGEREGFVKLVFDAATECLLGAHAIGANVSEIVGELALAKRLGATIDTIASTIHCHPTFHEAIAEAAAAAKGKAINI